MFTLVGCNWVGYSHSIPVPAADWQPVGDKLAEPAVGLAGLADRLVAVADKPVAVADKLAADKPADSAADKLAAWLAAVGSKPAEPGKDKPAAWAQHCLSA